MSDAPSRFMSSTRTDPAEAHARRTGGDVRVALRRALPLPLRDAIRWTDARLEYAHDRAFERWYGIETSENAYLDQLGMEGKGRAFYAGVAWLPLRRALRALDPGPEDVFVDLGSGKGQALIVAGQFRLARVIGVDLADELNEVARRNLARARHRLRASQYEVTTADVLEWQVPDDLSIVFMYCPFVGELFGRAMDRIFESYDRNPRPLHVLYAFPWEHNRLLATGRVEVVDVHPAEWPAKPWWPWSGWTMPTYRVIPAGAPPRRPRRRAAGPLRRRALERWSAPNDQRFALYRPGVGLIDTF
jgi:SAM-dependent methyltransferase